MSSAMANGSLSPVAVATDEAPVEATASAAGYTFAGKVKRLRLEHRPSQIYYLYVPRHLVQPVRVLVSVHGISRNAREHAKSFAGLAEERGVVVIAPYFERAHFPGYQRLAPDGDGMRPDQVLDEMVAEVRSLLGLPDSKLYLFGYSGGGQFVHRYVMAHPQKVARAVVGAPGWFTFPNLQRRYPEGLRVRPGTLPPLAPSEFLRVPVAVVVGSRDTERDQTLRQSRRIDRRQGGSRYERGLRWVGAMQAAALAHGLDTPYRFYTLPGVAHDFGEAMRYGRMGDTVMAYLFDQTRPATRVKQFSNFQGPPMSRTHNGINRSAWQP
jgi:pimeloyl-ACP methyl ester carboxylesterase